MILAVNTGSASKKYAIYDRDKEVFRAHLEWDGGGLMATFRFGEREEKRSVSEAEFSHGVELVLDRAEEAGIISDRAEIGRVGARIVAPGEYFYSHRLIGESFFRRLEEAMEEAPLHIAPITKELAEIREALPGADMIAVSDSEFHATLTPETRTYALPKEAAEKYGIYRYGYHGTSVRSALRGAEKLFGKVPGRVIVCHLGSGASLTAVRDGKSFDTTMGFTPLEGLVMGTRIGDIDPGALIYLGEKLGLSYGKLEEYLNKECGLLALSGKTADIRELLKLEADGDGSAKLALGVFVYRVRKYIGAYAAAMGGADALIFTATIGERSSILRERIVEGLDFLGFRVNKRKNKSPKQTPRIISGCFGKRVAVIPADELGEIARAAAEYGPSDHNSNK